MDIRKFFRPPLPQTNATRATAEPYQNHRIPAAEKELQEPTASEQPQLASGSNTAAQAPPAERSEREREHADYIANPRCSSGLSQTQGHDHSGPPDDLGEDKPAQIILKKFPSRLFNGTSDITLRISRGGGAFMFEHMHYTQALARGVHETRSAETYDNYLEHR
ncbi:unnamed protein product [Pleuronectes platessa]|uniref:Uncharacterized protein n=1 Tax=Pleuronectes platessa TaxID=8262 RepID=A0A9N7TSG8_PLEPL|nr:unnamed protein product [Pleuronectes platessa]